MKTRNLKNNCCLPTAKALLFSVASVLGDPGDLDLTFGGMGKVTTRIGSYAGANTLVLQPDGKIIAAGNAANGNNFDFALVRYNADGSLDTSFNGTGWLTTSFAEGPGEGVLHVALQSDGKILAAGWTFEDARYKFALARYNVDGSLDSTFNGTGKVITVFFRGDADHAHGVAVQPDGKIVVVGASSHGDYTGYDFALVRYNADGTLDTSFGFGGKVTTSIGKNSGATSVALLRDGKILVGGTSGPFLAGTHHDFALARYNPDGSLDTTFNGTGFVTTDIRGGGDQIYSITLQSDGKIVAAGISESMDGTTLALVRYHADGTIDTSFSGGKVITRLTNLTNCGANSAVLRNDGKILLVGYSDNGSDMDFGLARYNADGSLDTSFGGTGTVTTALGSGDDLGKGVAIQNDGSIVVAGHSWNGSTFEVAVARYEGGDGYAAQVQPPIKADQSSVFTAKRGAVPVKFTLSKNGSATCVLPAATIALWCLTGDTVEPVTKSVYVFPSNTGSTFRVEDCQYIYNLNSKALGSGKYLVEIVIYGRTVGSAIFQLR